MSVLQLRQAAGTLDRAQLTEINKWLTVESRKAPDGHHAGDGRADDAEERAASIAADTAAADPSRTPTVPPGTPPAPHPGAPPQASPGPPGSGRR